MAFIAALRLVVVGVFDFVFGFIVDCSDVIGSTTAVGLSAPDSTSVSDTATAVVCRFRVVRVVVVALLVVPVLLVAVAREAGLRRDGRSEPQ